MALSKKGADTCQIRTSFTSDGQ